MDRRRTARIERLGRLRELQRDVVSGAVASARQEREEAEQKACSAMEELKEQAGQLQQIVHTAEPVCAQDWRLSMECLRAASETAAELEQKHEAATKTVENQLERLSVVHRQVKQMDFLSAQIVKQNRKEVRQTEQRDMDELSVVKEVHR